MMRWQSRFCPEQRASTRIATRINPSPGIFFTIPIDSQSLNVPRSPQITQAVSSDAFERLVSRTIFWSYCFVAPPAMVGYALVAMLMTKL